MRRLLLTLLLLPSLAFGQSAAQRLSQVGHVLNTGSPAASALGGTETIPCVQGGVTSACTPAQIKTYVGASSGTVTSVSVATANGLSGTVATATTTPVITLNLSLTGDCSFSAGAITCTKTNGTAFSVLATTVPGTNMTTFLGYTWPALVNGDCLTNNGTALSWGSCGTGSGITLQTNGTNNTSQTTLNLQSGQGIAVTNPSAGNVSIASTVPQRTVTTSPTVASTDMGGLIVMNVTGGGTLTVPAISSTVLASGMSVGIVNYSASTAAVSTTPTINSGGGCVSGTGIPSGDTWQLFSNGTSLDCIQTVSASSGTTVAKSVVPFYAGAFSQATTNYSVPGSSGGAGVQVYQPYAATFKNLYVHTANSVVAGQTFTFTLFTAASWGTPTSTTLTCIISSGNSCTDTTDTVSLAAGGVWQLQSVTSATSGSTGTTYASIEVDAQ